MDSFLCGSVTSGMGTSGYNNYNCTFEKYDGTALEPDYDLRAKYGDGANLVTTLLVIGDDSTGSQTSIRPREVALPGDGAGIRL